MKPILAALAVTLSLTACNVAGPSSVVPGTTGSAPRETQDVLGGAPSARISLALFDAPPTTMPGANGKLYVQPSVTAANAAAKVSGTIKNRAGTPVSNAAVLATDLSGHVINATATGSDGRFTIHALLPGAYTIAVKNSHVTASGETITAVGNDAEAAPAQLIVLSPEDELELDTLVD